MHMFGDASVLHIPPRGPVRCPRVLHPPSRYMRRCSSLFGDVKSLYNGLGEKGQGRRVQGPSHFQGHGQNGQQRRPQASGQAREGASIGQPSAKHDTPRGLVRNAREDVARGQARESRDAASRG